LLVGSELEKKQLFDARKWKGIEGEESIDEKWEGTVCATFVVGSRVRIRRVTSFVCQLEDRALNRERNDEVASRMKLLSGTRARDFCRLVVVRQRARRRKLRADSIFCGKSRTRTFVVRVDNTQE